MQLYDASGEGTSLSDMSMILSSIPASAPILSKKVRDVAKGLAMAYPISWREIAILTIIRRIQVNGKRQVTFNVDNLADLIDQMMESMDMSMIPKEYSNLIKRVSSFSNSMEFKRRAEPQIKDFLSLNDKALEALTRELLYTGVAQEEDLDIPTQQQLDLVEKAIRTFMPGRKKWSILDASCGYGILPSFLKVGMKPSEEMDIHGIDTSQRKISTCRLVALADHTPEDNFQCMDLSEIVEGKKYDVVIYSSDWGEKKNSKSSLDKKFLEKSNYAKELSQCDTMDWAYAIKVIDLLDKDGLGIWFTSSKAMTSQRCQAIVDKVIEDNLIASIIRLPRDSTSKNVTSPLMVIFKKGRRPRDSLIQVDARRFVQKGRKAMYLPVDEILSQAAGRSKSNISQAFDPKTMISKDKKSSEVLLKDVTLDIFRGTDALTDEFISSHPSKTGQRYTILRLNDLQLGYIQENENNKVYLGEGEGQEFERFELRKGDILIKSRGSVVGSTIPGMELGRMPMCFIYDGSPTNVLASASFMVVRPDPTKLDSRYLKFYLQSRLGMEELNVQGSGKNSLMLTKSALGNIKIPLTSLDKQYQLGIDCLRYSQALSIAFQEFQKRMVEFTNYLYERFTKGE